LRPEFQHEICWLASLCPDVVQDFGSAVVSLVALQSHQGTLGVEFRW
jgi:hypothetical protein